MDLRLLILETNPDYLTRGVSELSRVTANWWSGADIHPRSGSHRTCTKRAWEPVVRDKVIELYRLDLGPGWAPRNVMQATVGLRHLRSHRKLCPRQLSGQRWMKLLCDCFTSTGNLPFLFLELHPSTHPCCIHLVPSCIHLVLTWYTI